MPASPWYARPFREPKTSMLVLLGALCALVPAIVMWGFTVDDALIPLRYAHHIGAGVGYRFNPTGPITDGVTPLPWAPLMVPLSFNDDLVVVLERVKLLGVLIWTVGGALLGRALAAKVRAAEAEDRGRVFALSVIALLTVALAFPIGAYAASGMETGVATTLATLAAISFDRPRRAAVLAGLVATFRPELLLWSIIVAAGAEIAAALSSAASLPEEDAARRPIVIGKRAALAVAVAALPFALCVVVRLVAFGRAAPLSLLAKPSDLHHGLIYAGAAALVVLTPILAFAPLTLIRRASPQAKTLAIAGFAHILVVVAVGGDWMPFARLMVPIAPSLALVFVDVGRVSHVAWTGARAFVAFSLGIAVAYSAAPAGRHVYETRRDLILSARTQLYRAHVIACADVGWVGAAAQPDAEIVDLGGVTDPTVAVLPGGHTSKSIDPSMLLDRNVDTILIYGQPRRVEGRLGSRALFKERYHLSDNININSPGRFYAVYERNKPGYQSDD